MFDIKKDFEDWVCSFSGCDGGNIKGGLWFCGIEWGGDAKDNWLREAVDRGAVNAIGFLKDDTELDEQLTYQYDQKLLKIYSVLCGSTANHYKTIARQNGYLTRDGHIFKMNLYPVAFGNTQADLWSRGHYEITGIPTKTMYKGFCQAKRFPLIQKWLAEYNPKVVICSGQSLYLDFIMAFCGFEDAHEIGKLLNAQRIDIVGNKKIRWALINNEQTLLVVTPFFGNAYGLNSDMQLDDVGRHIKNLASQHLSYSFS